MFFATSLTILITFLLLSEKWVRFLDHQKFINFFYMKQETSEFEMQMHKYCMGFHSTNFLDCFQNKICHFSIILLKLNEKSFILVPQKYHVSSVLFIFIYFYSFSTVGVFLQDVIKNVILRKISPMI